MRWIFNLVNELDALSPRNKALVIDLFVIAIICALC